MGRASCFRSAQEFDLATMKLARSDDDGLVRAGASWLRSVQNATGGFGETCASYDIQRRRPGTSTPSQTAWALIGLLVDCAHEDDPAIELAVEYLLDSQNASGNRG